MEPPLLWRRLILSLFRAKTVEDLEKIEALEVPYMTQAVRTYRETVADRRFREIARIREKASHDEAQALANAAQKAAASAKKAERRIWRAVVADKDAKLSAALAEKDAALAEIAALRAKLGTQPPQ